MNSSNWPWKFFDEVSLAIVKREDTNGDFYQTFGEIAKRWSELLGEELSPSNVIIMLLENALVFLRKDPTCIDKVVDATILLAYLSEINNRDKKSNTIMPVRQLSCSKKSLTNVGLE